MAVATALLTVTGLGVAAMPAHAAGGGTLVTLEPAKPHKLTAAEKAAAVAKFNNTVKKNQGTLTTRSTDRGAMKAKDTQVNIQSTGVSTQTTQQKPPPDPPPPPPPGWPGQVVLPPDYGSSLPTDPFPMVGELARNNMQTCLDSPNAGLGFVWSYEDINHMATCQLTSHLAVLRNAVTGAIMAQADFDTYTIHRSMDPNTPSRQTSAVTIVVVGPATGIGTDELNNSYFHVGILCQLGPAARSCTVGGSPGGDTRTLNQWADPAMGGVYHSFAAGEGDGWTGQPNQNNIAYYAQTVIVGNEVMPASAWARCDYSTYIKAVAFAPNTGCTYDGGTNVFARLLGSDPVVGTAADHVWTALYRPGQTYPTVSGKYGSEKVIVGGLNTGVPLTRLSDPKKIKANRDKAYRTCAGIKNFPNYGNPNFECDEFPFASTDQGAASGLDYSVRMIPKSANQTGGTYVENWEAAWRILPGDGGTGDPFFVDATQYVPVPDGP